MAIREGLWDCPNCDGTNRGGNIRCQGCGATRGPDVGFYLPDEAPAVLEDDPKYQLAIAGVDWTCPYCDTDNRAGTDRCRQCGGAARSEGDARAVQDLPSPSTSPPPIPGSAGGPPPIPIATAHQPASGENKGCGGCNPTCGGCLVFVFALFLAIYGVYSYFSQTEDLTAEVVEVRWTRTLERERFGTYRDEAWQKDVPSDAQVISQERRHHHDEKVLDHYETRSRTRSTQVPSGTESYKCGTTDMGNGFFKDKYCTRTIYQTKTWNENYQEPVYRKEPRYAQWFVYEVDRWRKTEPVKAAGKNHPGEWPIAETTDTLRISHRVATFTLTLQLERDGSQYQFSLEDSTHQGDEARFLKIPPGTAGVARLNYAGTVQAFYLEGELRPE